jgi:hypothetical protein
MLLPKKTKTEGPQRDLLARHSSPDLSARAKVLFNIADLAALVLEQVDGVGGVVHRDREIVREPPLF